MSCSTTYEESLQLHCNFPEKAGGFKAFAAYFTSSDGRERVIAKCAKQEDMKCRNEPGLSVQLHTEGIRATITLPDSYGQESGQFRCEVPGLPDVESCQWAPPVTKIPDGNLMPTASTGTPAVFEMPHGVKVGVAVGTTVFVVVVLFIGIALLHRFKFIRGVRRNGKSKDAVPDSEFTARTGLSGISARARKFCAPWISSRGVSANNVGQQAEYNKVSIMSADQARLLGMEDPRVFLAGQAGTGKSLVLFLKAKNWLHRGIDVFVVSTSEKSREECKRLYNQLQETIPKAAGRFGQLRFRQYNLNDEDILKNAVNDLSHAATVKSLHIIADGVWIGSGPGFNTFCDKLLAKVSSSSLYLWAASDYVEDRQLVHREWKLEVFNEPLCFPQSVMKEIRQQEAATPQLAYSQKDVLDLTESLPLKHRGQPAESSECFKLSREAAN